VSRNASDGWESWLLFHDHLEKSIVLKSFGGREIVQNRSSIGCVSQMFLGLFEEGRHHSNRDTI
jgi:hypothetical protein